MSVFDKNKLYLVFDNVATLMYAGYDKTAAIERQIQSVKNSFIVIDMPFTDDFVDRNLLKQDCEIGDQWEGKRYAIALHEAQKFTNMEFKPSVQIGQTVKLIDNPTDRGFIVDWKEGLVIDSRKSDKFKKISAIDSNYIQRYFWERDANLTKL